MNGFEDLGQFSRNDQGSLAQPGCQIVNRFQDAMRRLIKNQGLGMAT